MATPQPYANGDWFFNKHTGQIQHITNVLEKIWFEALTYEVAFRTEADAKAYKAQYQAHKTNPGNPSPVKDWFFDPESGTIFHGTEGEMGPPWIAFSSKAEAEAYSKKHPPNLGLGGVGTAISNGVSGTLGNIPGFISKLTEPVTILRIAEVIIGVALIIIGLGRITGMGHDLAGIAKAAKAVAA